MIRKLIVKILTPAIELLAKLTYIYNSWWNTFYFKKKCKEADKLNYITGKRYWVVPATKNKLMVVNNDYIKKYNTLVEKKYKLDIYKLENMAYYSTAKGTLLKRKPNKKTKI